MANYRNDMLEVASDTASMAAMCKALGDPTRLRIFEFLRSCCGPVSVDSKGNARPADGPSVGEICCQVTGLDRASSTISFHLKELRLAGLITVERRGKQMICGVDGRAVARLACYLAPRPPGAAGDPEYTEG